MLTSVTRLPAPGHTSHRKVGRATRTTLWGPNAREWAVLARSDAGTLKRVPSRSKFVSRKVAPCGPGIPPSQTNGRPRREASVHVLPPIRQAATQHLFGISHVRNQGNVRRMNGKRNKAGRGLRLSCEVELCKAPLAVRGLTASPCSHEIGGKWKFRRLAGEGFRSSDEELAKSLGSIPCLAMK